MRFSCTAICRLAEADLTGSGYIRVTYDDGGESDSTYEGGQASVEAGYDASPIHEAAEYDREFR